MRLIDSIDMAWLEDESRHEWKALPEAKDVLRRYGYAGRPLPQITDAGRIVRRGLRFRTKATPGKDLLLVMRTDAWYPTRLYISVDGRPAGLWTYSFSETAWVEPSFRVPGALVTRDRPEIAIDRDTDRNDAGSGAGRDFTPYRIWVYQ
jgi:hypothetical protein